MVTARLLFPGQAAPSAILRLLFARGSAVKPREHRSSSNFYALRQAHCRQSIRRAARLFRAERCFDLVNCFNLYESRHFAGGLRLRGWPTAGRCQGQILYMGSSKVASRYGVFSLSRSGPVSLCGRRRCHAYGTKNIDAYRPCRSTALYGSLPSYQGDFHSNVTRGSEGRFRGGRPDLSGGVALLHCVFSPTIQRVLDARVAGGISRWFLHFLPRGAAWRSVVTSTSSLSRQGIAQNSGSTGLRTPLCLCLRVVFRQSRQVISSLKKVRGRFEKPHYHVSDRQLVISSTSLDLVPVWVVGTAHISIIPTSTVGGKTAVKLH